MTTCTRSMRALLVCPAFPKGFWTFDRVLAMQGKKAMLPPLSLVTVAAILPQAWNFKLVDRNVRSVTEDEWDWAELVLVTGMLAQREDFAAIVAEARRRGKPVVAGGPYATTLPEHVKATGADYLVLDEGELTIPMFLQALERGESTGVFRSDEKPDLDATPVPRYDLLKLDDYSSLPVQFSRGCPFDCEFCDITVLYGRKPRTKTAMQLIRELDCLYDLGWRSGIFVVDDNFIGHKEKTKSVLRELKQWVERKKYPFAFITEASLDLASDPELLQLMVDCNFDKVFLGVETPDRDSLALAGKHQNTRQPIVEAIETITEAGLQVWAGLVIGFDGETPGAGQRLVELIEKTAIPVAIMTMLQVLPNTALARRLREAGRLIDQDGDMAPGTLMNFVPSRPIEQIANEYLEAFWHIYDPENYLDRNYRYFMKLNQPVHRYVPDNPVRLRIEPWIWRAAIALFWRQGVIRRGRGKFWLYLIRIMRRKPDLAKRYLANCAYAEHFIEYRRELRAHVHEQLSRHTEHATACTKLEVGERA